MSTELHKHNALNIKESQLSCLYARAVNELSFLGEKGSKIKMLTFLGDMDASQKEVDH